MTCILAATDLSIRSDRAVQRALRLGRVLNLPCHIISVIDDDLPSDLLATRKAEVAARLMRFVDSASAPGQDVTFDVIAGDVHAAVQAEAEARDAALLVLGLHRSRPLLDLIRETTMVRIVRATQRPVLLVRNPADHDYARVLAPVCFSPSCASALLAVRAIAPRAELRSFHAVPIPFSGLTGDGPGSAMARELCAEATAERDRWQASFDQRPDPINIEIISGYLSEIMARLTVDRPDLIAVGAHTRSGFVPSVLGSFVTDLIVTPPCDVLVVRA